MVLTIAILMLAAFVVGAGCALAGVYIGKQHEPKHCAHLVPPEQSSEPDKGTIPEPDIPPMTEAQQQYSRVFAEWLGGQAG